MSGTLVRLSGAFCLGLLFAMCGQAQACEPSSKAPVTVCRGLSCATVGATVLDGDKKHIIACLFSDTSSTIKVWKAMSVESSVPSGTVAYFNLAACPSGWVLSNGTAGTVDMRGAFVRGLDKARGLDVGRTLGSYQSDAIRNIAGRFVVPETYVKNGNVDQVTGPFSVAAVYGYRVGGDIQHDKSAYQVSFNAASSVPTAAENRPVNVALLACQKS